MTQDKHEKLAALVGDVLESEVSTLTDQLDLIGDMGLDSMNLAELSVRVRDEFGVEIRPRDLSKDSSVGALIDLITERQKDQ